MQMGSVRVEDRRTTQEIDMALWETGGFCEKQMTSIERAVREELTGD